MSRGRHCEVITDYDGTVLARVQLARCPTPEERAGLVTFFRRVRDDMAVRPGVESAPVPREPRGPA